MPVALPVRSLVGSWNGSSVGKAGEKYKIGLQFTPNKLVMTSRVVIPLASAYVTTVYAKYTMSGDVLSVKVTRGTGKSADPRVQKMFRDARKTYGPKYLAKLPPQHWSVQWKDDKNMRVTFADPIGASRIVDFVRKR